MKSYTAPMYRLCSLCQRGIAQEAANQATVSLSQSMDNGLRALIASLKGPPITQTLAGMSSPVKSP